MIKQFADWLFKKFCHPDYYHDIRGDLEEIYADLSIKSSKRKAHWLYLKEALLLFRWSLLRPIKFIDKLIPNGMIRNYFIIAFRQLIRNRTHTAINISGLAVGLACCLLISLYIIDELSYDKFQEDFELIYRLNSHSEIGGNERTWALAPSKAAPALKEHLPEVENFTRITTLSKSNQLITYDEKIFDGSVDGGPYGRVFWADSNFFDIFSFKPVKGDLNNAINRPNAVVITQRTAEKIFPDDQAIGKVLEFSNLGNFEVTAVLEDIPANSHLQFDYLLSNDFAPMPPPQGLFWTRIYFKVHPKTDVSIISSKIDSVARQAEISMLQNGVKMSYWPAPITDIHLTSGLEYELYPTNDIRYIYIFSAISLFILIIASINFINLSTAQLAKRAKEVGIRKVMGAGRRQMVAQFFIQSISVVFISALLAFAISYLAIGGFNSFTEKSLALTTIINFESGLIILALLILIGLVAGLYPALVMSAFSPIAALKENFKPHSVSQWLRKILVAFQFGVSVVLITSTFIIVDQLYFLKNLELGFDKDQILIMTVDRNEPYSNLDVLRNRMLMLSGVAEASLASGAPGRSSNVMVMTPEGFDNKDAQRMDGIYADYDFTKTFGLKLLAGRDFDPSRPSDSLNYLINKSAVKKFGWKLDEAPNRELAYPQTVGRAPSQPGKIIGVVDDFHYQSLHNEIGPLVIGIHASNFPLLGLNFLNLRIRGGELKSTLSEVEGIWEDMYPAKPLTYDFVDSYFNRQYETEERLSQTISAFAILGILIACLGLFGLALYVTQQKTKEIGIRKVLGATVLHIVGKLSGNFVKLVVLANLIAWPIVWYFMSDWLNGFAYHVEISPWVFVAAGIGSLLIALFTIGFHTTKAAVANPVKSLRYE
ncbi:MAG: FtsX-like permease family protein [Cyclobacteriaceae bacterium]